MKIFKRVFLSLVFTSTWILLPNMYSEHTIEYVHPKFDYISPEERLLKNMSLEEKVGQLFMFGFYGTSLSKNTESWLKDKHIGGVLLLGRNIKNEKQLKNLISDIQNTSPIPLFISIDQEGGPVSRLQWNSVLTMSQRNMDSTKEAYKIALERGNQLKDIGINMNLAPVVEYITDSSSFMYKRVFTGSKELVAKKGEYAIYGYMEESIIPVPKHYPGHSNTSPDSHFYLPKVNITQKQWNSYIYPFKYLIENNCVDILMVGHVLYPNIDSKVSTVSYEIVTERLKNDLDFNGVVISDDMEMDAIKDTGDVKILAKQSLLAGIDILIYSKETKEQSDVYKYILEQFKKGEMKEDTLNEKVLRILQLKSKYGLLKDVFTQQSLM